MRHHANSAVAYAQAHDGQYAGRACRIEKGVVAVGALARDQQHVGVLVFSSVRIFHYVEVVIVYAVALHVALAKPKGKVHGRGSGPRAVCLCVYHQARAAMVAVAHRGDTEQAFYAGNHCQLHVSFAEHASKQHVVARGFYAATLVLRYTGRIGVGVRNGVRCLPDVGVLIHRCGIFVVLHQRVDEMFDLSRVVALRVRLELNARDCPVPIAYGRRDVYRGGCNLGACEQLGVGDDGGRCDKLRHAARLDVAGRAEADIQRVRRISTQCELRALEHILVAIVHRHIPRIEECGPRPRPSLGGPLEHHELEYHIDIDVCTHAQPRKLVSICLLVPNEQREGCGTAHGRRSDACNAGSKGDGKSDLDGERARRVGIVERNVLEKRRAAAVRVGTHSERQLRQHPRVDV